MPLLPATKGLINSTNLALARSGTVVLNFSREGIVDDAAVISALDGGKLKAIGVISPHRIPGYDVMTMVEAGMKGFTDEAWYGLLAPAKASPDVVARLTEAMKKVMAQPEVRAQLEKVGARPVGSSAAEFTAQIRGDVARMKRLVQERQIKLDE